MEGYNGWANYATWNISLWIMNEESSYRAMRRQMPFTPESAEEFCRELYPEGTPDFDSVDDYDLVDWNEIADAFNEDFHE